VSITSPGAAECDLGGLRLRADSAPPVEGGWCAAFVDKQADRAGAHAGGAGVPAIESMGTQCGVGHRTSHSAARAEFRVGASSTTIT
jgi:hypothetical protein